MILEILLCPFQQAFHICMGPMSRRKQGNSSYWYWGKMSLGRKYKTTKLVKRSFGAMGVNDGKGSKGSFLDFLVRSAFGLTLWSTSTAYFGVTYVIFNLQKQYTFQESS